jgi:hypothetical protein
MTYLNVRRQAVHPATGAMTISMCLLVRSKPLTSDSAIAFHCSGLFLSGPCVPIRPFLKGLALMNLSPEHREIIDLVYYQE